MNFFTSSRAAPARPHGSFTAEDGGHTVGVLVQGNFGARAELTVAGVPVGQEITDLLPDLSWN